MKIKNYLLVFCCLSVWISMGSCYKLLPIVPPGTTVPPPAGNEVYPVSDWLHSFPRDHSTLDTIDQDQIMTSPAGVQTGVTFTTSVAASIVSIGLGMPDSGYNYTISLWDGETKVLLAGVAGATNFNYVNGTGGVFTYVSLATAIPIQPGHTYVVGIYSLPFYPANALAGEYYSTNPNGDQYNVYNLVSRRPGMKESTNTVNIFPYTDGPITVTGCWVYTYSSVLTSPQKLVYPVGAPAVSEPNMVGCADVGVIY